MIDSRFAVVDNPRHAAYMLHALIAAGEPINTAENLHATATEMGFQITQEYAGKVLGWHENYMRDKARRDQEPEQ